MRIVLFDLDGTLLDGSRLPQAVRDTCDEAAAIVPGLDGPRLVAANSAAWQRLWPDLEADYMLGGRTGDELERQVWRAALDDCGVDDLRALDAVVDAWRRHDRAALRLFDDVLPALDALSGARMGLVTNGSASVQRAKLAATGLDGRFDPVVISSEAGAQKPDPAIFEIALTACSANPSDAVFVGDNLWHDIAGAAAVGIPTVWIDRAGKGASADAPRPDMTITALPGRAAWWAQSGLV